MWSIYKQTRKNKRFFSGIFFHFSVFIQPTKHKRERGERPRINPTNHLNTHSFFTITTATIKLYLCFYCLPVYNKHFLRFVFFFPFFSHSHLLLNDNIVNVIAYGILCCFRITYIYVHLILFLLWCGEFYVALKLCFKFLFV